MDQDYFPPPVSFPHAPAAWTKPAERVTPAVIWALAQIYRDRVSFGSNTHGWWMGMRVTPEARAQVPELGDVEEIFLVFAFPGGEA